MNFHFVLSLCSEFSNIYFNYFVLVFICRLAMILRRLQPHQISCNCGSVLQHELCQGIPNHLIAIILSSSFCLTHVGYNGT